MSQQLHLKAEPRPQRGKGVSGRLRRQGRVPAILYGYEVEPTPVSVDALELYHALRTEAGLNALLRVEVDGETHLCVARDLQRHPVKGDTLHADFLAVDRDTPISVEVPVHLTDEEDTAPDNGVINQILYSVPVLVKPLEVPNFFELSVAGAAIGDVRRIEDLVDQLPEGAEFELDHDSTVVTINAPVSEAELEALEEPTEEAEAAEAASEAGEAEPAEEA